MLPTSPSGALGCGFGLGPFEKLEYQLEEEFGCGIRLAVKAAPRSILGESPSQVLGLFLHLAVTHFSFLRPLAAVSLRLAQTGTSALNKTSSVLLSAFREPSK
jgi:hypothetical protein